jgi:hypothetical protein
VRVRSQAGLARLSISNQLLVPLARPDATFVAGFNTWIRLPSGGVVSGCIAQLRRKFSPQKLPLRKSGDL